MLNQVEHLDNPQHRSLARCSTLLERFLVAAPFRVLPRENWETMLCDAFTSVGDLVTLHILMLIIRTNQLYKGVEGDRCIRQSVTKDDSYILILDKCGAFFVPSSVTLVSFR